MGGVRRTIAIAASLGTVAAFSLFLRRSDGEPVAPSLQAGPAEEPREVQLEEPREAQPAVLEHPEPTREAPAPRRWSVRYVVVDEGGHPVEGAIVRFVFARPELGSAEATTDAEGACSFELDPAGDALDPLTSLGHAEIRGSPRGAETIDPLPRAAFAAAPSIERRVAIERRGSVRITVRDQHGAPVPGAIVVVELARVAIPEFVLSDAEARTFRESAAGRLLADPEGRTPELPLVPAAWVARAPTARDYGTAATGVFEIESGRTTELELRVQRWERGTYASGRAISDELQGNGTVPSTRYGVRRSLAPGFVFEIMDDGCFFVIATSEPQAWELVRLDGALCSGPVMLANGIHDVRLVSECDGRR